jgi:hypothetical protein
MSESVVEVLKRQAIERGYPPEGVEDLWVRHVRWANENGRDLGGRAWLALVEKAKADAVVPMIPRTDPDAAEERQKAEARKRAEDEYYAVSAISFFDYLEELRARNPMDLDAIYLALVSAPPPGPLDTGLDWLHATVQGVETGPRRHRCGRCGAPVRSWTREGRRYFGARCADCSEQERDGARP